MTTSLRALAAVALAGSCHGHSHDEPTKGEHGHAHASAELPGQSVTVWASRTELFMEYPPLIVGQEVRFAAHVTEIPSWKAVTAGAARVTLTLADGTALQAAAETPAQPGIFRPAVVPTRPGACQLTFTVTSPQVTETFAAGACRVFENEQAARAALSAPLSAPLSGVDDPAGRISFLKEQQWKTDFALTLVAPRDLQDGVRASGEIRPAAGRQARVVAPASGRVDLATPVPLLGTDVKQGTLLATVAPRTTSGADRPTLLAEVSAFHAEVQAARNDLARAQRLVGDQAAPTKSLDEARTRLQVAEARLGGATGRLGQFDATASGRGGGRRLQLRAPVDGVLVALDAATGQTVEEGAPLFELIDLTRVWLVARVFEPDIPRIEQARTAWFTIDGHEQPFTVDDTNATLVTIGRVIDPKTRTIPVIFELANRAGRLRIGNFAKVVIATGAPRRALAIPESAIIEDAGKSVAFVMVEGESFERRPLQLGIRSHRWVEVREGLAAGERVVTTGAYEVRLAASAGTAPAHGHAH